MSRAACAPDREDQVTVVILAEEEGADEPDSSFCSLACDAPLENAVRSWAFSKGVPVHVVGLEDLQGRVLDLHQSPKDLGWGRRVELRAFPMDEDWMERDAQGAGAAAVTPATSESGARAAAVNDSGEAQATPSPAGAPSKKKQKKAATTSASKADPAVKAVKAELASTPGEAVQGAPAGAAPGPSGPPAGAGSAAAAAPMPGVQAPLAETDPAVKEEVASTPGEAVQAAIAAPPTSGRAAPEPSSSPAAAGSTAAAAPVPGVQADATVKRELASAAGEAAQAAAAGAPPASDMAAPEPSGPPAAAAGSADAEALVPGAEVGPPPLPPPAVPPPSAGVTSGKAASKKRTLAAVKQEPSSSQGPAVAREAAQGSKPTKVAKKEPADDAGRSGKERPGEDDPIVYEQQNPKMPGKPPYIRYERYKVARTPREALELGAVPGDLIHDWNKGFLRRAG